MRRWVDGRPSVSTWSTVSPLVPVGVSSVGRRVARRCVVGPLVPWSPLVDVVDGRPWSPGRRVDGRPWSPSVAPSVAPSVERAREVDACAPVVGRSVSTVGRQKKTPHT